MAFIRFFRRQLVVPFETSFAVFCIYMGIAGMVPYGLLGQVFEESLGRRLSVIFCAGHVLAGLCLYFGIGLNRRNLEAFGLITIIGSLLVRTLAVYTHLGLDPLVASSYAYGLLFIVSAIVRLYSLVNGITIVETKPPRL